MPDVTPVPKTSPSSPVFDAFTCVGIELEYMVVDRTSYQPLAIVDSLLNQGACESDDNQHPIKTPINELFFGPIGWSNELARHVLEFKTGAPAKDWDKLVAQFQHEVERANRLLCDHQATLLPGGVHPWMDPGTQAQIWPHGQNEIYLAYDRIFGCKGHGWFNVQSMHINLPFRGEEQFRRLHSAIRLVLPIVVALSASSPVLDGQITGAMSERMRRYANNQHKVPEIVGAIIPDVAESIAGYHKQILAPMYQAIASFDPEGILQHEWLNSRGAIARFDRSSIEIRVADTQECPLADLSIAFLVNAWIHQIYDEDYCQLPSQESFATRDLAAQLQVCTTKGRRAEIQDNNWARALGGTGNERTVDELIAGAVQRSLQNGCPSSLIDAVSSLAQRPELSARMLSYVDGQCSRASLSGLCTAMSRSLATGQFLEQRLP